MSAPAAFVAYGVRLTEFSGHGDLLTYVDRHTAWAVRGQVAGEQQVFLVRYAASAAPGDLIAFEPVVPRRHLWDAELDAVLKERGWKATEPGWMLFFAHNESR